MTKVRQQFTIYTKRKKIINQRNIFSKFALTCVRYETNYFNFFIAL